MPVHTGPGPTKSHGLQPPTPERDDSARDDRGIEHDVRDRNRRDQSERARVDEERASQGPRKKLRAQNPGAHTCQVEWGYTECKYEDAMTPVGKKAVLSTEQWLCDCGIDPGQRGAFVTDDGQYVYECASEFSNLCRCQSLGAIEAVEEAHTRICSVQVIERASGARMLRRASD